MPSLVSRARASSGEQHGLRQADGTSDAHAKDTANFSAAAAWYFGRRSRHAERSDGLRATAPGRWKVRRLRRTGVRPSTTIRHAANARASIDCLIATDRELSSDHHDCRPAHGAGEGRRAAGTCGPPTPQPSRAASKATHLDGPVAADRAEGATGKVAPW